MAQAIHIGVIGAGTVGGGVVSILQGNCGLIEQRLGVPMQLRRVADSNPATLAALGLPEGVATHDGFAVVNDPDVHVVVELVGGDGIARELTLAAFAAGKHVVTANKALVATHGEELFSAANKAGVQYMFEAAVGGGIPILRAMRESFTGDRIESMLGIINGTANYILTRMTDNGEAFGPVLADAQALGYAEADPTYDIDGIDTAHKLALLVGMAFGGQVGLDDIHTEGIRGIEPVDLDYAKAFGCKVKLLAIAKAHQDGSIEARVHPTMVDQSRLIAQVDGVFNAVAVTGDRVGETLFYGQGAGAMATGSAVVGDLVAVARDIRTGSRDRVPPMAFQADQRSPLTIRPMAQIESLYYLRLTVVDEPGVLADISGLFGQHQISIARVIQEGQSSESVALVIMTHRAREQNLRQALAEIEALNCVTAPTTVIRVESDDA